MLLMIVVAGLQIRPVPIGSQRELGKINSLCGCLVGRDGDAWALAQQSGPERRVFAESALRVGVRTSLNR